MRKELLKGLSKEQIAKVKACKSQEEVLTLAKEEGIELTDEQLEAVSGGGCTAPEVKCPKCGAGEDDIHSMLQYYGRSYWCLKCDHRWNN